MKTTKRRPLVTNLRRARRLHNGRGITQRQAAKIAGVSVETIHRYEAATKLPRAIIVLLRLARAYQVPLDALLADELDEQITDEVERNRAGLESRFS